jgi:hypothetical protein
MKQIRFFRRTAVVLFVASSVACYTQTPIDTYPPPANTRIEAQVTDSGVVAMGNALGPGAAEVQGIVVSTTTDSLSLQMLRVDHRGGNSVEWNREVVKFPRYALMRTTETRLDKKRSWMAVAGIGLGAFLVSRAFRAYGADEPPDDEQPPANTLLIPLGRSR